MQNDTFQAQTKYTCKNLDHDICDATHASYSMSAFGFNIRGFGKYLVLKTFSDKVTIMFKSEHDFFTSFLGAGEIKYNLVVSLGLKTTSFIFGSISLAGL